MAINSRVLRKTLVVPSQLCLKFGANIKQMGWLKKGKSKGRQKKTSKFQDRKLKTVRPENRKCSPKQRKKKINGLKQESMFVREL